ncbi:MAG: winged helix-turn-helix domain-containing protein [Gammaproteobacteria bacterium]|nr:winged helix-turn-helix domain-containing protein [Gammaproteobacteria bacterium]
MSSKKKGPGMSSKASAKKDKSSTEKLREAARAEIKKRLEDTPDKDIAAKGTRAKAAKAPKEAKPKRVSALDAAAQVLAKSEVPMRAKELIAAMEKQGLWSSPGGKTPHATLYAAMIREIAALGDKARFKKHERGVFVATGHAARAAKEGA